AQDCSDGGLAGALAVSWVTGPVHGRGGALDIPGEMRPDALLFGESASRIVVSVLPEQVERLRAIAREHGVPCAVLGAVGGDHLALRGLRFNLHLSVEALHWAWSTGLSRLLG
ncbi:MAG: AIR synthase-related protein, partial [candidate division NC10 bacterium]